jgi:galactokinase/mevalonate kinase-like predicted kinase
VKSNNQDIDKMVRKKQEKEGEHLYLRRERKMMKHEEEKMRKDIILSADVICCTLSGSGSALLHKLLNTARYVKKLLTSTGEEYRRYGRDNNYKDLAYHFVQVSATFMK